MKNGETWIVTAERLEPIQSLGLSFVRANLVIVVVPFGAFTGCEESDPATFETLHITRLPASEELQTTSAKPEKQIRRLATDVNRLFMQPDSVRKLVDVLPEDGEWIALTEARRQYLALVGGFPPKAYKQFNEAIERAAGAGIVESSPKT